MSDVINAAPAIGGEATRPRRGRSWFFYTAIAAALLTFAIPMAPFLVIPFAWPFLAEQLGVHQFHDVGVAIILWLIVAGLLAQFRKPESQIGAMQQVLLVILVMVSLTAISRPATLLSPMLLPFGFAFLAAALHPARAQIARLKLRIDPVLAALVLLAAGPAALYGLGQLRLDHSAIPLVAHGGHWTAMATVAFLLIVLALLGAMCPRGWRVPVWSAGAAAFLFGVASAALPALPSSMGLVWGMLAAAWGIAFVIIAELRNRGVRAVEPTSPPYSVPLP